MQRVLVATMVLSAGCIEEQRYIVENEAVAITEDTPAAFTDDDDNEFFVVERTFEFPISRPSDATLSRLTQEAQGMNLPFPRLPWVEREDTELQLDYVLANLDDTDVVATMTLDGVNEFFRYAPGQEDFHQWERKVALKPKERVRGTITELEMDEIATDLATVVNGAPNSNLVVQFQSQSGRDPRIAQYVPKVVPGLIALQGGLIVEGQAANVVLEVSVRAQDHGDRICARGERRWQQPEPMDFVPVAPEEE